MTFNKIEAGMMALHRESVAVLDYVHCCVGTFAAEARERSIHVVVINEHVVNVVDAAAGAGAGTEAVVGRTADMVGPESSQGSGRPSLRRPHLLLQNSRSVAAPARGSVTARKTGSNLFEVLSSDDFLADKFKVLL